MKNWKNKKVWMILLGTPENPLDLGQHVDIYL